MAVRKRGRRRLVPDLVDDGNKKGMAHLLSEFLEWRRIHGYSETTVAGLEWLLRRFGHWCAERGITRPDEVTRPMLEQFQKWLFYFRRENGKPLSVANQMTYLSAVRVFFRWLARQGYLLSNPAADLETPRREHRIPRRVLSRVEVETLLAQPDIKDVFGLRDRTMLEVLYSTGIRRRELTNLSIYDVHQENGTVLIRSGKGKKDRVIPIGDRAIGWLQKYLEDSRPTLAAGSNAQDLFLNYMGTALHPSTLTELVRNYVIKSGVAPTGSCHLLRHAMATLMLEGGADIRFIQSMLGHAELTTTQIYTHVSIKKLKEIHNATHPGARDAPATVTAATEGTESDVDLDALMDALEKEDREDDDAKVSTA